MVGRRIVNHCGVIGFRWVRKGIVNRNERLFSWHESVNRRVKSWSSRGGAFLCFRWCGSFDQRSMIRVAICRWWNARSHRFATPNVEGEPPGQLSCRRGSVRSERGRHRSCQSEWFDWGSTHRTTGRWPPL